MKKSKKLKMLEKHLVPCQCGTKPQIWMTLDKTEIKVECPNCHNQVTVTGSKEVESGATQFVTDDWNTGPVAISFMRLK